MAKYPLGSVPWAVPQLGSCASSRRARRSGRLGTPRRGHVHVVAARHRQQQTVHRRPTAGSLKVPPPLAAPRLGFCASSGRAWRLWAARHSQGEANTLSAQPLPRVLELAASKAAHFPAL